MMMENLIIAGVEFMFGMTLVAINAKGKQFIFNLTDKFYRKIL